MFVYREPQQATEPLSFDIAIKEPQQVTEQVAKRNTDQVTDQVAKCNTDQVAKRRTDRVADRFVHACQCLVRVLTCYIYARQFRRAVSRACLLAVSPAMPQQVFLSVSG